MPDPVLGFKNFLIGPGFPDQIPENTEIPSLGYRRIEVMLLFECHRGWTQLRFPYV